MQRKFSMVMMVGALALALNACSDDADKKEVKPDGGAVGPCLQQDSNSCAAANSTCTAKCVADEACIKQCQDTFCGCMNKAGCGAPAECKSTPVSDGGNKGTTPDPDKGTTPDPDNGVGVCLQDDINNCALTKGTCVAVCVADQECLDDCQTDFCDCMELAECQPPAECVI